MRNINLQPLHKYLTTEVYPTELARILDEAILQIVESHAANGMVPSRSDLNDVHYLRTLRNKLLLAEGITLFEP